MSRKRQRPAKSWQAAVFLLSFSQQRLDLRLHHIERDIIAAAVEDNVGEGLRRFDVEVVHGLDGGEVLVDDALEASAALADVARDAAQDALVGVGFDVDLDVEEISEACVLENQDALDDDDAARPDGDGLFRARVLREVVGRAGDSPSGAQFLEVMDEEVCVERVRVVVVDGAPLLEREIVVRLVVVVVIDDGDGVTEGALEAVREG